MSSLHKSAASIGFYGDNLDPEGVSAALGCQPTVAVRKGGTWLTAHSTEKLARIGSWRIETARREPADLDGEIVDLLGRLTADLSVWRALSNRYDAKAFCGLFLVEDNEGMSLAPATLSMLGDRGLTLDLDIYFAGMPE